MGNIHYIFTSALLYFTAQLGAAKLGAATVGAVKLGAAKLGAAKFLPPSWAPPSFCRQVVRPQVKFGAKLGAAKV